MTPGQLGYNPVADAMTPREFRQLVGEALVAHFGAELVDLAQDKHIGLEETSTTLEADVVPCFALARYDAPGHDVRGIRIFPLSGGSIDNFPQQNLDNSNEKDRGTSRRYKEIVRCMKRLVIELHEEGKIGQPYPGYLVESLVYDVPNNRFANPRRYDDMDGVIKYIWSGLRDESHMAWTEPNELIHLFKGWRDRFPGTAFMIANAAWDFMEL